MYLSLLYLYWANLSGLLSKNHTFSRSWSHHYLTNGAIIKRKWNDLLSVSFFYNETIREYSKHRTKLYETYIVVLPCTAGLKSFISRRNFLWSFLLLKVRLYGCAASDGVRWFSQVTYGDTALVRAASRSPIKLELFNKSNSPAFICAQVHFNREYEFYLKSNRKNLD